MNVVEGMGCVYCGNGEGNERSCEAEEGLLEEANVCSKREILFSLLFSH